MRRKRKQETTFVSNSGEVDPSKSSIGIVTEYSEDLIACTGDVSLAEVISAGKLPLYFLRRHKSTMLSELIDLVEYYLGEMYPWANPVAHPLYNYLLQLRYAFLGETEYPEYESLLEDYLDALPTYFNARTFERMTYDWRRITNRIRAEWNGEHALLHSVKELFFKSQDWAAEFLTEQEALLRSYQTEGEDNRAALARFEDFLNSKKCSNRAYN